MFWEEKSTGSGHPEKKSQWEVVVLGRGTNEKWPSWEEEPMVIGYPGTGKLWELKKDMTGRIT